QADLAAYSEGQEYLDAVWKQVPDGLIYEVSLNVDVACSGLFGEETGRRVKHCAFTDRHGQLAFAARPQGAPVIHFGGPLALHVRPGERLRRGEDPKQMNLWLGTPGLGPGTFAFTWYDLVPQDVHPVVEVRFPAREAGRQSVTQKYVLKERC